MKHLAVLALLLATSCLPYGAEPLPGYAQSWQDGDRLDPFPAASTALALTVFAGEWQATFGDDADIADVVNNVRVHWVPASRIPGYAGLTPDMWTVLVVKSGRPISHTALIHEMVHVALWRIVGDPDADHALGDGPWTPAHDALIQRAELRLQAMGL